MRFPYAKYSVLSGWGRTAPAKCLTFRPERRAHAEAVFRQHPATVLVRGQGRGYGDAAVNAEGTLLSERLNHFLAFDEEKGVLTAQSGVTLSEVVALTVPRGWLPQVIPGTKQVSLGGCVASDVHGKNQYRRGNFGRHVLALTLLLPGGHRVVCSQTQEPGLFYATLGGLGMTGMIEEVTLQLMPIVSSTLAAERVRVPSVAEMVERFRTHASGAQYMVGWFDHVGTGTRGAGIFEHANHMDTGGALATYHPSQPRFTVPSVVPPFALNRLAIGFYNRLRLSKVPAVPEMRQIGFDEFFHPLDGIGAWNRLYGRRGLLQYQCLIPENEWAVARIEEVLRTFHDAKVFSYLAVIKYHAPEEGMLSFAGHGFSLALDFPAVPRAFPVLDELDRRIIAWGGKVYLAKDARLAKENFELMYAEALPRWRSIVQAADPHGHMNSAMNLRLNLRGDA